MAGRNCTATTHSLSIPSMNKGIDWWKPRRGNGRMPCRKELLCLSMLLLWICLLLPSANCTKAVRKTSHVDFRRQHILIRGGGDQHHNSAQPQQSTSQNIQETPKTTFHHPQAPNSFAQQAAMISPTPPKFRSAIYVAIANILLFALRPEETMHWFTRVPRLLWEFSLLSILTWASLLVARPLYLLVATMAFSTAMVDVFFWAPIYDFFTSFETCTTEGPPILRFFLAHEETTRCVTDLAKGLSRGAVTILAVFGGLVYWGTAMDAWSAYVACRDEQKTHRMRQEWQFQQQQHLQQQQPQLSSGNNRPFLGGS